jgi:hypothetical protein
MGIGVQERVSRRDGLNIVLVVLGPKGVDLVLRALGTQTFAAASKALAFSPIFYPSRLLQRFSELCQLAYLQAVGL